MSRLSDLRKVRSLKQARKWLGLSLREMAMLIKPQGVRPQKHLGKATIAAWENPRDKRKPSDWTGKTSVATDCDKADTGDGPHGRYHHACQ